MDKLETVHTLTTIVESMLPRFGSKPKDRQWDLKCPSVALYIHLDLRTSFFNDDGREVNASANLHFIFERPSNYTKVWVAQSDLWGCPDRDRFIMSHDHDSCWRDISIHDVVRSLQADVLAQTEQFGRPPDEKTVRSKMHSFHSIHSISWVRVTYEKDPDDIRSHAKRLITLEPITRKQAMEEGSILERDA